MKNLISFFFKRKKEEPIKEVKKNLFDKNIYCELIWDRNEPEKISLFGCNEMLNLREFCGDLFNYSYIHGNQPIKGIYIPRIIYSIDWGYIFKNGISLRNFKLTFTNYSSGTKNYSVILEAVNAFENKVIDTFTSTSKVFIDSYELSENIDKFIKFAEEYEIHKK